MNGERSASTDVPRHRVVLLGASNLTISFRRIVGLVRAGFAGKVDAFAAHGHGRSYGTWSTIPGRALPGIVECQLWDDLADSHRPSVGTHVLLTDVGNDLIYGTSPDILLRWVRTCLERLEPLAPEFVITRLPIENMETLSKAHYDLFVKLIFPFCRVTFDQMRERARHVDEGLVALAKRYCVVTFEPPAAWYGLDPIHVLPQYRQPVWRSVLAGWPSLSLPPSGRPRPIFSTWSWLAQRPAERRLLGRTQHTRQPILLRDDVRLHVY